MLKQCEDLKNKCGRITVAGHGVRYGIGTSCAKGHTWVDECFGCDETGKPSKCFEQILACFKTLLSPGGYLRICSCKTVNVEDRDWQCIMKMKAALGGAKVCFCTGEAWPVIGNYCHCFGQWKCV
jgi:hypothetical protein